MQENVIAGCHQEVVAVDDGKTKQMIGFVLSNKNILSRQRKWFESNGKKHAALEVFFFCIKPDPDPSLTLTKAP